ncbi:MAG: hypothetical protein U0587_13940 [Candidatus Binatia bacterium]
MAQKLETPITVKSVGAEYAYLRAHPCTCGGAWRVERQAVMPPSEDSVFVDSLSVRCEACGSESSVVFRLKQSSADAEVELRELEDFLGKLEEDD